MSYKNEFIDFMIESDVLKFGDFTLKSGRKSPFFMNAGAYVTGSQLKKLGEYYAKAINDKFGVDFDALAKTFDDISSGTEQTVRELAENIATFEEDKPLSDEEKSVLYEIARKRLEKTTLPCTSCRYCTDHCPKELDIPNLP